VVNSSDYEQWVSVSGDGLILLFQSTRPGGEYGGLYMSRRKSGDDHWVAPVYLGLPMNGSVYTLLSSISADGTMLYLSDHVNYASRAGGSGSADMWQVPVMPIVDLNDDGIVDSVDMCFIVDNWGTDEPMCDIGPTPFGDGIVDVQDLIVLAEHLFEDYRLVAHWALDETEGIIAKDSTGYNDAYVIGDPLWQPTKGRKDGALQLDGIDDYVVSVPVLNPSDGPFSVFAWIKGSAPGQVIISQMDGTGSGETWLGMDAMSGCLMTGLVPPPVGRFVAQPLSSQAIVTDGLWHHVGFVWDGFYRILYVDGSEVATDAATLAPMKSSNGGLYIATSKDLGEGRFFSGMIDDVRVYNKALNAETIAALAK